MSRRRGAGGLEESLAKFTAPETLAMANAYLCEKCKRRTQAVKRIALLTLPNVLVIQLKRFSYAGGKVTRHVHFPAVLDMEAYLAEPSRGGHTSCYDLHGVIVHSVSRSCAQSAQPPDALSAPRLA